MVCRYVSFSFSYHLSVFPPPGPYYCIRVGNFWGSVRATISWRKFLRNAKAYNIGGYGHPNSVEKTFMCGCEIRESFLLCSNLSRSVSVPSPIVLLFRLVSFSFPPLLSFLSFLHLQSVLWFYAAINIIPVYPPHGVCRGQHRFFFYISHQILPQERGIRDRETQKAY